MKYKNIKALCRKDTATLVGVISRISYRSVNQQEYNKQRKYVEDKNDIVLLPIEFSLEHYKDNKDKIASYCEYRSIEEFSDEKTKTSKDEKSAFDIKVGYACLNRCKVLDIKLKENQVFVDIEMIENQCFQPEHDELRKIIFERFKEYLKYSDVSLAQVENVKKAENVEKLIESIVLACEYDIAAKRKLLEEYYATDRLKLLLSELETRIYEQKSDKGNDTFSFYKNKINEIDLPADIKTIIYDELSRLKYMKSGQAEFGNCMDWLDRVCSLPWGIIKEENCDIDYAKKMLNETHYGMDLLKQKILDYIALKMVSGKNSSQIMCLYGPPGVGKSTIVKSIAKALNKDYYSFSLGGVSNPEEINGMKRFYVGAKSGRIMEGIAQAGSKNCIILLDEIDKMSSKGQRGDPYSALLDILDKNQNEKFKDKYYDIPFDLSQVMFIATANELYPIPEPIRNRLEIITIDGYSLNEKLHIAQEYILPKTLKEIGVQAKLISFSDKTLQTLIEDYTFESGVRQLERLIMEVCRKYIVSKFTSKQELSKKEISLSLAREYLGDFYEEEYNVAQEGEIGVVNKMSVKGPIGSVSRLEISLVKGNGEQIVSDNLVGTAKWTFKTVFGLVKSKANEWNIDLKIFDENNFYIHSPHHAISHDGPSGGVADVMCLISAIKELPINHKLAFTGEISLKGKVLAIGGIKEKLLAAQRNKIDTVVVPLANKKDIEKLSNEIVGQMKIKYVDNINEAYDFVFKQNGRLN